MIARGAKTRRPDETARRARQGPPSLRPRAGVDAAALRPRRVSSRPAQQLLAADRASPTRATDRCAPPRWATTRADPRGRGRARPEAGAPAARRAVESAAPPPGIRKTDRGPHRGRAELLPTSRPGVPPVRPRMATRHPATAGAGTARRSCGRVGGRPHPRRFPSATTPTARHGARPPRLSVTSCPPVGAWVWIRAARTPSPCTRAPSPRRARRLLRERSAPARASPAGGPRRARRAVSRGDAAPSAASAGGRVVDRITHARGRRSPTAASVIRTPGRASRHAGRPGRERHPRAREGAARRRGGHRFACAPPIGHTHSPSAFTGGDLCFEDAGPLADDASDLRILAVASASRGRSAPADPARPRTAPSAPPAPG